MKNLHFQAFKSSVGRIAREVGVYLKLLNQRRRDEAAVLFFPSQGLDDGAARLRAYHVADEMAKLGWRVLVCPKQLGLRARHRIIKVFKPDVIVLQTARHPLNRPRLYPGQRIVIDLDDADYIDSQSAPAITEAVSASTSVIAGSRAVAEFCKTYNNHVAIVWTGTPPSHGDVPSQQTRRRVITWAASSPLGSPHEASFIANVLKGLVEKKIDFAFQIYCDDGSDQFHDFVSRLVPPGVEFETLPYLSYDLFLQSLDVVAVGLAPLIDLDGFSGGKSFGKVLAYLDRSVPVVTHPVVDHPLFFSSGVNGFMYESVDDWVTIIDQLLADAALRDAIARKAHQDFVERLTTQTAARHVDRILREAISR